MQCSSTSRNETLPSFTAPASAASTFATQSIPVSMKVSWISTNSGCTPATASTSPSFKRLTTTSAAFLSPPKAASRRSVDPYELCKSELSCFVDLQEELVLLVQQLQDSLCGYSSSSWAVARDEASNAENLCPGRTQGTLPALRRRAVRKHDSDAAAQGGARDSKEVGTGEDFVDAHTVVPSTPSAIVHRLHLLQHESAELVDTRCLPALAHLLFTFDSYWSWKHTHVQEDADNDGTSKREAERQPHGGNAVASSRRSSLASTTVASDAYDAKARTTAGEDAAAAAGMPCGPSSLSSSSSLRQRYDHVVRVRDELCSFLKLHAEAVRALEPYLQRWLHSDHAAKLREERSSASLNAREGHVKVRGTATPGPSSSESTQQFLIYVQEVLEVTQTTRHVAHLLQVALAALCRPSPRLEAKRAAEAPRGPAAASLAFPWEGNAGGDLRLQSLSQQAADAGDKAGRSHVNRRSRSPLHRDPEGKKHDQISEAFSDKRASKSRSPRTPFSQRVAASEEHPLSSTSGDNPLLTAQAARSLKNDDKTWMDVLSPLTPPPSSTSAAAAAALKDGGLSSADFSPSPRSPPADNRCPYRHTTTVRSSEYTCKTNEAATTALSPPSMSSSSLSPSAAAAAVSLSPLTVTRHGNAGEVAAAVAHDAHHTRSTSRSTSLGSSSPPAAPAAAHVAEDEGESRCVSAAVSPAPAAPRETSRRGKEEAHTMKYADATAGGEGVRSLLSELTSAQGESANNEKSRAARLMFPPQSQSQASVCSSTHRKDSNGEGMDAASVVYVPPADLRSISPRSSSFASSSARPVAAVAEWSRSRSSGDEERSAARGQSSERNAGEAAAEEEDGDDALAAGGVGRAASVPSLLWPQLATHAGVAKGGAEKDEDVESSEDQNEAEDKQPCSAHRDEEGNTLSRSSGKACVDKSSLFYTSHGRLSSEVASQQPSSTPSTSTAPSLQAKPAPSTAVPSHSLPPSSAMVTATQQQQQRSDADMQLSSARPAFTACSAAPPNVEVEVLEKEAAAMEAVLRRPHPARVHRRERRWVPLRSPSHISVASSSSSSSSLPSSFSSIPNAPHTRWPRQLRQLQPRRHGDRHRRHTRRSDEERLERTVHRELAALRKEQRHNLHSMQREVREALEEVMSVATSAAEAVAASSRASSRHSTATDHEREQSGSSTVCGGHHSGEREAGSGRDEGRDDVQSRPAKPRCKREAQERTPRTSSTHVPPSTAAAADDEPEMEAEALRESLAAAEARAARLEQLTIQLKKRLWLTEYANESSTQARSTGAADQRSVSAEQESAKGVKHRFSLRDAFVYGGAHLTSREAMQQQQSSRLESSTSASDAAGARAEEEALLYLVDRALADRHASRCGAGSNTSLCEDSNSALRASPSPLKCFDDAPWQQQQRSVQDVALSTTRSPQIRQQRASIFRCLRHDFHCASSARANNGSGIASADSTRPRALNGAAFGEAGEIPSNRVSPEVQEKALPSQLSPPPPMLPLPSASSATAPTAFPRDGGAASTTVDARTAHPYSQIRSTASPPVLLDASVRVASRPSFAGASSSSQYYASISNSGVRNPFARGPEGGVGGSTLLAEQVLQNARRLLQSRSDAHQRSRSTSSERESAFRREEGRYTVPCKIEGKEGEEGKWRRDDGGASAPITHYSSVLPTAATVSCSGTGNSDSNNSFLNHLHNNDDVFSPPPPPYTEAAVMTSSTSPQQAQSHPFTQQRWADAKQSPCRSTAAAGMMGMLQSPSNAAQYYGYDTSPCSAVAYSTGKLPRASPHRQREESVDVDGSQAEPEATTQKVDTVSFGPWCRESSRNVVRRREARVDSATSPMASPASDRHRSRAAIHVPREEEEEEEAKDFHKEETTRRNRASASQRRSNSSGERQVSWHDRGRALSQTVSRHSSRSSCGSAQEELLDTLEGQEALLQRALKQLKTQRRQLREKRSQVAERRASARRRASHAEKTTTARSGASPLSSTAPRNTRAEERQLKKLTELLDRLDAAEETLTERERRVERAVKVIQRQKAALVSEDFL